METKARLVKLHDLFDILHGNKFDFNKMEQCTPSQDAIAFVGRSGNNGGVVGFVRKFRETTPFDPGRITVALGGAALSSFVQSWPFYTAQNIDVLAPKKQMPLEVKMYYCLCIEANRFRYSTYGREANRTLKDLLVPDPDNIPAWVNGAISEAVQSLVGDLKGFSGLTTSPRVASA